MDKARYRLAQEIYFEMLELPATQRAHTLAQRCGNDLALREDVESLLELDAQHTGHLATGGAFSQLRGMGDGGDAWTGRRLGPWSLDGVLGRGGMGMVFSATRVGSTFDQRVAVKVLTHRVFDQEGHDRFDRERRMLARLDHPRIARLIDGGVSDDGVPYLVMEYVDGIPIDQWCEQQQLSVADRLRLFRRVCDAVQHAHGRLILHRDLKPSNVLVTHDGHPKLLDFGVARALPGGDDTEVTQVGLAPLTPEYAAPEQFAGTELSAATDVYQLGVMLYRLLTGVLPFRQKEGQLAPLLQHVMETVPRAPSTVVLTQPGEPAGTSGGSLTSTERRELRNTLRGDLDDIVLMALRKEADQRYRTVDELAADIDAYLTQRPVRAHGGNRAYRVRKFVARHRTAVALASLVCVSVLVGGAATARATWRAQQAAAQSVREAKKAGAIQQFLQQMLSSADPLRTGGNVSVREALDRAATALDTAFLGEPSIRAGLYSTVGQTYVSLGAVREGDRFLDSALVAYEQLGESWSREAYAAHAARAYGHMLENNFAELRATVADARPGFEQAFGARDSTTLQLGALDAVGAFGTGSVREAIDSLDMILPKLRSTLGSSAPNVAFNELVLANLLALQAERTDEAVKLVENGLRIVEPLGIGNATYLAVQGFAVEGLARLGRPQEAVALGRSLVARHEELWGEGSKSTFGSRRLLALALLENRRPDTALLVLAAVVEDARPLLADDHPLRIMLEQDYATLLLSFGRASEAETLLRKAHAFHAARDGDNSPKAMLAYQNLAGAVQAQGRTDEAIAMVESVVESHRASGRGGNDLFFAVLQLAELRNTTLGDSATLAVIDEYLPTARERLPRGNRALNMMLARQGQALLRTGRTEEAELVLHEVRENYLAERGGNAQHPDVKFATQALAALYEQTGKLAEAERLRDQVP